MIRIGSVVTSDRFQRVILRDVESDCVFVPSDVPQESILGLSLFILFLSDLTSQFDSSKCLLFADDANIFKCSNITGCLILQADLNSLLAWCMMWKISLEFKKCFYMCSDDNHSKCFFTKISI